MHMSTALGISIPGDGANYPGGVNYTWNIRPTDIIAGSIINFALSAWYLPATTDELVLYEGRTQTESKVLGKWNSDTASANIHTQWYQTTSQEALLVFRSQANTGTSTTGNFKMNYFSDGPNYHCGAPIDPVEMAAASFTFTDGSSSTEQIYRNQSCRFTINPPGTY